MKKPSDHIHLRIVHSMAVGIKPTLSSCVAAWSVDTATAPQRIFEYVRDDCRRAGDNLVSSTVGGLFIATGTTCILLAAGLIPGVLTALVISKMELGPAWTKAAFYGSTIGSASQMMLAFAGSPRLVRLLDPKATNHPSI